MGASASAILGDGEASPRNMAKTSETQAGDAAVVPETPTTVLHSNLMDQHIPTVRQLASPDDGHFEMLRANLHEDPPACM